MKRSLIRLAIAPVPTLLISLASAQDIASSPFYARLSLATPSSSSVRDDLSNLGYGVSFGYNIASGVPMLGTAVEVGYLGAQGHGNRFHSIDVLARGRYTLGRGKASPYVGLGVGLAFTEIHKKGGTTNNGGSGGSGGSGGQQFAQRASGFDTGSSGTHSTTTGVLDLMAGFNLDAKSFVELGYRVAPKVQGVRQDFLSLSYGIRF